MKILILANCQGPALEAILISSFGAEGGLLEVMPAPPTYTWDKDYREVLDHNLELCDILLYQPHQTRPGLAPWRSSDYWLEKSAAPHKISFPSLYFSGYNPELTYVRKADGHHLNEGFCDYHDFRFIEMFLSGLSAEQSNNRVDKYWLDKEVALAYAEQSLDELAHRESEQHLDIQISAHVREHYKERRLFFTFNHPSNEILIHVAQQLLRILKSNSTELKVPTHELLRFDAIPVMLSVQTALNLPFKDEPEKYMIQNEPLTRLDTIKRYFNIYQENAELIKAFFSKNRKSRNFRIKDESELEIYENKSSEELAKSKQGIESELLSRSLRDPEFTQFKCNPQTLSFMSDISFQLRKLYPNIETNVKDVLDVGARTAIGSWFLQNLHHPGSFSALKMKVTAIDIERNHEQYATCFFPDINYVVGDIFHLPEKSRDIVICSHTIEHVANPRNFIDQLCKIAREYVIIACPYDEPAEQLIPGHLHSINQDFIDEYNYDLLEVYTSMHWHQSKACIFAINAGTMA